MATSRALSEKVDMDARNPGAGNVEANWFVMRGERAIPDFGRPRPSTSARPIRCGCDPIFAIIDIDEMTTGEGISVISYLMIRFKSNRLIGREKFSVVNS
jgi:hypothetical protein